MKLDFSFWTNASMRRKRIYFAIFIFAISVIATAIGTLVPVSSQEANQISSNLNQTVASLKENGGLTQYIFGNNFLICLLMFVPIIGPALGLFVLFNTGTVLGAIASSQGIPVGLAFFALAITPVFWLEFAAYSVAMSESVWMFRRMLQGRSWREFKNLGMFVLISALLLVIGAIVEVLLLYSVG